jgi:hypothetical protein
VYDIGKPGKVIIWIILYRKEKFTK